MGDIDWDIELSRIRQPRNPTNQESVDALAGDQRRIYRAEVDLGMPIEDVLRPITRHDSPENEKGYYPNSLSIEIGPITCFDLESEQPLHVGWISVNLSGNGYLYPWTFREVVDRLHATPEITRITEVCRFFWPVPPEAPKRKIVKLRKQFPDLWPYDDFAKPWDWYWGLQESG